MHVGDAALLTFIGSGVRLYGVEGPNGGTAIIALDGKRLGICNFHASQKLVGVNVYSSPELPSGPHALSVVVAGSKLQHRSAYVNIDYAEILP